MKVCPPGNGGVRGDGIADIGQHTGTNVEIPGKRENIEMRFDRLETQGALVCNAVLVKAAAVTDHVEASAHVGEVRHARRNFHAPTQQGTLHADANSVGIAARGSF